MDINLQIQKSFFQSWLEMVIHFSIYWLGFAILIYLVTEFYKNRWSNFKIQSKQSDKAQITFEFIHFFLTLIVFGFVAALVNTQVLSTTTPRPPAHDFSYLRFIGELILLILIHDCYFYFTHRLLHWGPLYKYVHSVHHQSANPSAFAALSFHPIEAFVQILIVLLVSFIPGIQMQSILVFRDITFLINIYGHCGYEVCPKNLLGSVGKVLVTGVMHNHHHMLARDNYGLYTTLWDRVFKTFNANPLFDFIGKRASSS